MNDCHRWVIIIRINLQGNAIIEYNIADLDVWRNESEYVSIFLLKVSYLKEIIIQMMHY